MFFWDDFLCFRWKRRSTPARELLVGLVSPVGDRWAVFRGICCILVPTGCCPDLEGMEHWEMSLGILRQSMPMRKRCLNSVHCFLQYLCVVHLGSFLCGVLPGEERSGNCHREEDPGAGNGSSRVSLPNVPIQDVANLAPLMRGKPPLVVSRCELTFHLLVTKFWLIFLKNGDSSSLS